jgi:hypothetical protein
VKFYYLILLQLTLACPSYGDALLRQSVHTAVKGLSAVKASSSLECDPVCPQYLLNLSGEEKACPALERKHFKAPGVLDAGFITWSGSETSFEKSCLQNVPDLGRQSLAVSEYHYSMTRLGLGAALHLDEVASIDSILGEPLLKGFDCKEVSNWSYLKKSCDGLKSNKECKQNNNLKTLTKETLAALEAKKKLTRLVRTNIDEKKKADAQMAVKSLNEKYPWLMGDIFFKKCSAWKSCSESQVAEALTSQLREDREKHLGSILQTNNSASCLHDPKASKEFCENHERYLDSMPDIDFDSFDESDRQKDLKSEFARVVCVREERKKKELKRTLAKEAAISVGLTAFSFGTGTMIRAAMIAQKAKSVRQVLNAGLWTTSFGLNIAFLSPALKEAKLECDNILKFALSEESKTPSAEVSCPKEMVYGKGNYAHDYRSCMTAVSLAALDMLPLAASIAPLFIKEGRVVASVAAYKTAAKATGRLGTKAKRGVIKYVKQVKSSKGKRLFIAPRDNSKQGLLTKLNDFTFNPIATVFNTRRKASFPVSMVGYSLLFEKPLEKYKEKKISEALAMTEDNKESIPGGEYTWDLMESGAIEKEKLIELLGNHDDDFDQWLTTKDPSKLQRLRRLHSVLGLSTDETSELNQLALQVYAKELKEYKESSATGTKEERSAFNSNIVKVLGQKIAENPILKNRSELEIELLSTVYFPVIPFKDTQEDDVSLTKKLIQTPEVLKLLPQGLSLSESLLMVSHPASPGKSARAKQILPKELHKVSDRPDFPWLKEGQFLSAPNGKVIELKDELDYWKLLSTDYRFKGPYEMYRKGKLNDVEAMKYIEKAAENFNTIYGVIQEKGKKKLTLDQAQVVLSTPFFSPVLDELSEKAEKEKWSKEVVTQKVIDAATIWLEFHEKLAVDPSVKPDAFEARYKKVL